MSLAKQRFDQISGTLNNGGKFYTSKAIGDMEIEMPGGTAGISETAVTAATALAAGYSASLSSSISSSAVENNMHGSAWTLLNNFSGTAGIRTAINSANPTWLTQLDAYVPWASGVANL
jgi:hypothetical protein